MNGIPKEDNVRSISLYALSNVDITFDQDTDRHFARQQVFKPLRDITLPNGVSPAVAPLTSPSGLIYRYTLQSPDRSPTELQTFEDWTVEPQFRSVSGGLRLRPIMMTALVAAPGLLPAAIATGVGTDTQRPFAAAIVGRLVTYLLIIIFLMPALYTLVAREGDRLEV